LVWHLGPKSDDSLTINSIDGILFRSPDEKNSGSFMDNLRLELFTGKLTEVSGNPAATDATASGDVDLSNIEVKVVDVIPGGRIRAALLMGQADQTSATADNIHLNIWRVGINGGLSENMITYRAEYLQNTGQANGAGTPTGDLDFAGNAIDLGLGFNSKDTSVGSFGLWGNIVMASGDDTNDDEDESFHDFTSLGGNSSDRYFGEIFGKSNTLGGGIPIGQGLETGSEGQGMTVFNLGLQFNPAFAKKYWAKVDFFHLTRPEDSLNNTDVGDEFGTEFDLTLGFNHSDNVGIEGGYAMLTPDDALTGVGATNDETITKWFARANVKWGGEDK
jgi:hypothetical protein